MPPIPLPDRPDALRAVDEGRANPVEVFVAGWEYTGSDPTIRAAWCSQLLDALESVREAAAVGAADAEVVERIAPSGHVFILDGQDWSRLNGYKWSVLIGRGRVKSVIRNGVNAEGKRRTFSMHRDIMAPANGEHVDHINRDPLDNRRVNLRLCSNAQNQCNSVKPRTRSSYRGVGPRNSGWEARISLRDKDLYLGVFRTPEQAAHAYNLAAIQYHGEFATLNQIPSGSNLASNGETA